MRFRRTAKVHPGVTRLQRLTWLQFNRLSRRILVHTAGSDRSVRNGYYSCFSLMDFLNARCHFALSRSLIINHHAICIQKVERAAEAEKGAAKERKRFLSTNDCVQPVGTEIMIGA